LGYIKKPKSKIKFPYKTVKQVGLAGANQNFSLGGRGTDIEAVCNYVLILKIV
jgi:hypothetical protein